MFILFLTTLTLLVNLVQCFAKHIGIGFHIICKYFYTLFAFQTDLQYLSHTEFLVKYPNFFPYGFKMMINNDDYQNSHYINYYISNF